MVERQLCIFLENKPGVLAKVCKTLAGEGINLRGMSVSDTVDHSVVRIVTDDPDKATHVLEAGGLLVVEREVLAVKLSNRPGALGALARRLSGAKVNIEYAYGSSNGEEGLIFLRVSDTKKALKALAPKKKAKKRKKK